jgi:hypothetical protein
MLNLLIVIGLAARVAEPAATRPRPLSNALVSRGFFDSAKSAGVVVRPTLLAPASRSAAKPECPVRVRPVDPAVDAAMVRDLAPPVDASMAVPAACTARAVH